jgi:hypothetical protein
VAVFVIDKRKKPLMPCPPKRARQLLERGRAVVHKSYPFTIRIKDRTDGEAQSVRIKIDPGSKKTGTAVVRGKSDGINRKHCNLIHRADGYGYGLRPAALPPPPEEGRHPRGGLR